MITRLIWIPGRGYITEWDDDDRPEAWPEARLCAEWMEWAALKPT